MRKRRTRYTWFPNIGFQGDDEDNDFAGFPFTVQVPNQANTLGVPVITDLIPDFAAEQPTSTDNNLSDFIGNEYILKRIVGKCFIAPAESDSTAATDIIVAAGFFIARADEAAPQVPIGSTGGLDIKLNYGPLNNQTTRHPWIWRRAWRLQNPASPIQVGYITTGSGGSLQDGPHIDAKSVRRVRLDERLFFAVQAGNFGAAVSNTLDLSGYLDYRCLGALRKAKNRSAF